MAPTPTVPKPPKLVLGDDLEYRVARLHIFMGYFVRRGCPIYTVANLDQATDLDVFSLKYNQAFRREVLIAECKGGDVGPLDRIFWLSGVRNFVNAREAFLVRKSTKWNIKDFAKKAGIQVIDLNKLEELEGNFKIGATDWPGPSDRDFYAKHVAEWNKVLDAASGLWELYHTLISEIRFDEPFAALNYLLFQLRRLTKQHEKPPSLVFHRFLLTECLSQLSIFLLRICESAVDLSPKDREGYIMKGLTYGSLDPKFAEKILNNAYTITRQALLHVTNQPVDIDPTFFRMPVPPGAEQVRNLVNELLRTYPLSLTLPQITDLVLNEVILKQNRTGGWLKRVFASGDVAPRLELTKSYLRHLIEVDACPKWLLEQLQTNTQENGTKHDAASAPPSHEANKSPEALKTAEVSEAQTTGRNNQALGPNTGPQPPENKNPAADSDSTPPKQFELEPPPK